MPGSRRSGVQCACCGGDCYDSCPLRVVCVECNPSLDICLQCFASSVTVGQHRASHQYRIEEGEKFPLLSSNWSPNELSQLLEGLEQFGYGNWGDVSRYVDTKGPVECRDAVNHYFVDGPIGNRTYSETSRGKATDHTPRLNPGPESRVGDAEDLAYNELVVLGWMPSRDEFEVEYCNDAETLVSCLDQGKNDEVEEELDMALKLAHVEIYQAKLKERERRRLTAAEHELVKVFLSDESGSYRQSSVKPKKKDGKTEASDKLKIVSMFQTVEEHRKFISSMGREKELKSRIKELNRYRKNGVLRSRDAEEFDTQRLRRNKIKSERKRALEAGLDPTSASALESYSSGVDLDTVTSIAGLPGYDMLSSSEKRLCLSLRLHPNLYTAYKTCLIRDHIQKRRGQIIRPLHPVGLDKAHRKKIFNFLVHAGWISAY